MKKLFPVLAGSFLFVACNNNGAEQSETEVDTTTADLSYHWEARDTGRLEMVKMPGGGPDTIAPAPMIRFLNNQYPNVQLVFKKISGDTIFVAIPEATYLTQQMGSYGPRGFFAEAVYNLTEIPGIRHVDFDFEEGDHASPSTLNRNSFGED